MPRQKMLQYDAKEVGADAREPGFVHGQLTLNSPTVDDGAVPRQSPRHRPDLCANQTRDLALLGRAVTGNKEPQHIAQALRDERGLPLPKIALPARQKPVSATSSIPPIIEERHAPHQPGPAVRPPLEVLLVRETFPRRSWLALVVVAAVIVTAIVLGLTFMLYRQHQASRALAAQVESLSAQLAKQRESLADRIARALAPEAGAAPVGISTKDDRIYLAFSSDEGFASGRADLMPMLARQLDRLATVLADTRGKVIVLGHTDDAPGPRDRMESNLALSTLRATAVARHLQERRIASDRLSIIGRGAKDPVGDNRTAAGRALNRRVEIVLENEPM